MPMRLQVIDEQVLARASEAAEHERRNKQQRDGSKRRCNRQAMRALERKHEIEELRANLSDFEDYDVDET